MIINQKSLFSQAESKVGKVEKPSKIAKEVARSFKCELCGQMVSRLEGNMCTPCYCEKLAKRNIVK